MGKLDGFVRELFGALAGLAVGLLNPFAVRAFLREWRGLCPKCGHRPDDQDREWCPRCRAGRAARCPQCDYDLRGLSENSCPECGWRRDSE